MKVAVASDHAGLEFKEKVKQILQALGHEPVDCGTNSKDSVDYPDFGLKAARAVAAGEVDYGITVCFTGNGMNMACNKVKGIRAGMALNADMAFLTRSHNDANMLTLAQKYTPEDQLEEIIRTFLTTPFEGGRHVARVHKISCAELQREMTEDAVLFKGAIWGSIEMFLDNLEEWRECEWVKRNLDGSKMICTQCQVCCREIPRDELSEVYVVDNDGESITFALDGSEREECSPFLCEVDCFEKFVKGHGPN